jgi:hypothetical protein
MRLQALASVGPVICQNGILASDVDIGTVIRVVVERHWRAMIARRSCPRGCPDQTRMLVRMHGNAVHDDLVAGEPAASPELEG